VDFRLSSHRRARFSAVSNLFLTSFLVEFVKYCPETPLTSGDEAKCTDVLAALSGEIENGRDR
jgi:hypothetical protein